MEGRQGGKRLLWRKNATKIFLNASQVNYMVYIETEGKPGDVICKVAKEKKAQQIVMGNRGLGMIRRTFLGSVSQHVIDHANIPVTIIPPEKQS